MCYIQETDIQGSSFVIRSVRFRLHHFGCPKVAYSDAVGNGMAVSERAKVALLDRIPINSRFCTTRLSDSCKVNKGRSDGHNFFVASEYAPTDCNPDVVKEASYQKLHSLSRRAILVGDMNAREDRLFSNEAYLGGLFDIDSCPCERRNVFCLFLRLPIVPRCYGLQNS